MLCLLLRTPGNVYFVRMLVCLVGFLLTCNHRSGGVVVQELVAASDAEIDGNIRRRKEEDDAAFQKIDEEVSALTRKKDFFCLVLFCHPDHEYSPTLCSADGILV